MLSSKGLKNRQTNIPNKAANKHHERISRMVEESCSLEASYCSEISRTPLVGIPKFVAETTILMVELKRETSPIPVVPKSKAANLLRTKPMRILNPCTLPKMPVYFSI